MELLNYVLQSTSDFLFSHTSVIWLGSCIWVSYCPSINAFISFPIRWDFLLLCWFCLSFACQHLVHLDFQCFIYLSIFLCHTVVSLLIVWSLSPWLSLLRKRLKPFKMVVTRYNAESAPGGLGVGGGGMLVCFFHADETFTLFSVQGTHIWRIGTFKGSDCLTAGAWYAIY